MPRLLDSARPPREVRSFRVLLIAIYTMRSLTAWEHAHAFVRRGARGTAQGGPAPAAGGNVQRVVCLRCGKSRRVLKEAKFSWGLGPCATLAVGRPQARGRLVPVNSILSPYCFLQKPPTVLSACPGCESQWCISKNKCYLETFVHQYVSPH